MVPDESHPSTGNPVADSPTESIQVDHSSFPPAFPKHMAMRRRMIVRVDIYTEGPISDDARHEEFSAWCKVYRTDVVYTTSPTRPYLHCRFTLSPTPNHRDQS